MCSPWTQVPRDKTLVSQEDDGADIVTVPSLRFYSLFFCRDFSSFYFYSCMSTVFASLAPHIHPPSALPIPLSPLSLSFVASSLITMVIKLYVCINTTQ